MWSNGSQMNPAFNWGNWGPGEPNNYRKNEDCVCFWYRGGKWNDLDCNKKAQYVCEKSNRPPMNAFRGTLPTEEMKTDADGQPLPADHKSFRGTLPADQVSLSTGTTADGQPLPADHKAFRGTLPAADQWGTTADGQPLPADHKAFRGTLAAWGTTADGKSLPADHKAFRGTLPADHMRTDANGQPLPADHKSFRGSSPADQAQILASLSLETIAETDEEEPMFTV
jgi:hypothetical protein